MRRAIYYCFGLITATAEAQRGASPSRPWIGIAVDSAVDLVVRAVEPGSPAAQARLSSGMRITHLNERPVTYTMLANAMASARVGETLLVRARRGGAESSHRITIGSREASVRPPIPDLPDSVAASTVAYLMDACLAISVDRPPAPRDSSAGRGRSMAIRRGCVRDSQPSSVIARSNDPHYRMAPNVLGMFLFGLNPGLAAALSVPGRGLLVVDVATGSAAARAGIRSGDVILRVNGDSLPTLARIMQLGHAQQTIAVDVVRAAQRIAVTIRRE